MLMSNLISDLITDLISNLGIASMLNHTINLDFDNKIYGMINMEAIPKSDIKSDIRFGDRFDIRIKQNTWAHFFCNCYWSLGFQSLSKILRLGKNN